MARTGRSGLSAEQKRELWVRWKNGQSLSEVVSLVVVYEAADGVQQPPW